jgi:hypothetical protein
LQDSTIKEHHPQEHCCQKKGSKSCAGGT